MSILYYVIGSVGALWIVLAGIARITKSLMLSHLLLFGGFVGTIICPIHKIKQEDLFIRVIAKYNAIAGICMIVIALVGYIFWIKFIYIFIAFIVFLVAMPLIARTQVRMFL